MKFTLFIVHFNYTTILIFVYFLFFNSERLTVSIWSDNGCQCFNAVCKSACLIHKHWFSHNMTKNL